MSTLAYAALTNRRDAAPPGTSTTTDSPGVRTYVDTFAALVPAEVLTLHALIIAQTTIAVTGPPASTAIAPGAAPTLAVAFWTLLALTVPLYVAPRYFGGRWDKLDWFRMTIAPLAFVGWTMLQRTTAFDAAFPTALLIPRTVAALVLGAVLGAVTAGLALKADAKPAG